MVKMQQEQRHDVRGDSSFEGNNNNNGQYHQESSNDEGDYSHNLSSRRGDDLKKNEGPSSMQQKTTKRKNRRKKATKTNIVVVNRRCYSYLFLSMMVMVTLCCYCFKETTLDRLPYVVGVHSMPLDHIFSWKKESKNSNNDNLEMKKESHQSSSSSLSSSHHHNNNQSDNINNHHHQISTTTTTRIGGDQSNNNKRPTKFPTHEIFEEIVQVPIQFTNEEEESLSKKLVEALTENEIATAARTSYAYWYLDEETNNNNDKRSCEDDSSNIRMRMMAMKEARRHLIAEKYDYDSALTRLQESCAYRQQQQLESIRTCFNTKPSDDELSDIEKEYQQQIEHDFHRQAVVMRAVTSTTSSENPTQQPVLVKFPRHQDGTTEQEYLKSQLYIAERAVACTEYATRGQIEKVMVVMDGTHHSSQYTPPISWQLSAIKRIQQLYPERLGRLIVLDPPFWMRGIYHGIRPFLSQTTRDKIQMVSSSSYTSTSPSASASSVSVDDQQIQTIMNRWRRRGTQSSTDDTGTRTTEDVDDEDDYLSSPVDVHRYLYDTPFFCPYGSNRNCED